MSTCCIVQSIMLGPARKRGGGGYIPRLIRGLRNRCVPDHQCRGHASREGHHAGVLMHACRAHAGRCRSWQYRSLAASAARRPRRDRGVAWRARGDPLPRQAGVGVASVLRWECVHACEHTCMRSTREHVWMYAYMWHCVYVLGVMRTVQMWARVMAKTPDGGMGVVNRTAACLRGEGGDMLRTQPYLSQPLNGLQSPPGQPSRRVNSCRAPRSLAC